MKTVNQIKPAYTHYIQPKLGKLYAQMNNENVSIEDMKRNIRNYIYPARYSFQQNGRTIYTKKAWFLNELKNIETKQGLYFFCVNSVRRAKETIAR